jgi:hypothetical protein
MTISKARLFGVAIAGAGLLSGCSFGDSPPDPEVQPLEVIAGNPERRPCLLNVHEVAAGTHDVMVLSMSGTATARILAPSGGVVFKRVVTAHPAKGGGQVVTEEDQGSVRLEAGDYRVQCTVSGGTHSVTLRVVPARPGHTETTPADRRLPGRAFETPSKGGCVRDPAGSITAPRHTSVVSPLWRLAHVVLVRLEDDRGHGLGWAGDQRWTRR